MMKKCTLVLLALIMSLVMIGSNIVVFAENTPAPDKAVVQATAQPKATPANQEKVVDEISLKVNLDGSSTLSYSGVIDKKYHSMLKQQYEPMGYKVVSIKMGPKKDKDALMLTKTTPKDKPFNISMPGQDTANFEALKVKRWFYDLYVMNAKFDMTQYPTSETLMNVKVTLPVLTTYNNAASHSWNTYNWQLKGQKNNSVDFIILVPNFLNIAILIILIVIILLVISLIRKNKKKLAALDDEIISDGEESLIDGEEATNEDTENGENITEMADFDTTEITDDDDIVEDVPEEKEDEE